MKVTKALAAAAVAASLLLQMGVASAEQKQAPAQPGAGAPAPSVTISPARPASTPGLPRNLTLSKDEIVYSHAVVEENLSFNLGGHTLKVVGDLTISGTLVMGGGKLIVTGNLIIEKGLLVMTKAADYVEVGKTLIANGGDETNRLTAGKIKVSGDLLQLNSYSDCSLNTTGMLATELGGANKLVQFMSPAGSSLRNPTFLSGTTFIASDRSVAVNLCYIDSSGRTTVVPTVYASTGGTFLSISKALTADYAVAAPNVYYAGTQGGWKLTVSGNLIVPAGASFAITGNVAAANFYAMGLVTMAAAGKTVAAANLFSLNGTLNQTAGSIVTKRFESSGGGIVASGAADTNVTITKYTTRGVALTAAGAIFTGSLGGRGLAVTGALAVPAGGTLAPQGGSVSVTGSVTVDGTLTMNNPADKMVAGGDFLARGTTSVYQAGALEVGGKFRQCGASAGGSTMSFVAGPAFVVRLRGTASAWGASFDNPETSWFAAVEVPAQPARPMVAGSLLSIRYNLSSNLILPAPASLVYAGSLGGRRLSVPGSLTVLAGQTLDVGGGRLDVSGDMTVRGSLVMTRAADAVVVGGKFTAAGGSSAGRLTAGYLALLGGFEQSGDAASFAASDGHKTLLCGSAAQTIAFASPGPSTFANLYVLNPAVSAGQAEALPSAAEPVVTSTRLNGIDVNASGALPLWPAFGAGLTYEAVVPRGVATAAVTPVPKLPNQTATLRAGATVLPSPDVSVPPTVTTVVTVETVSAAGLPYPGAGAPFSATYTLSLQPENPALSAPGTAVAPSPAFNPAVKAYAVTVPAKEGSFSFTPVTANPNATVRFICGGQGGAGPTFAHAIAPGQTVSVDAVVTAYVNGTMTAPIAETYTFAFRRQTLLDGIDLSAGSLDKPFAHETADYTVDVPASAWAVTVTPRKGDGCARLKMDGAERNSLELMPELGGSATVTIEAADQTGTFTRTYRVTVRRAALLSGITVSSRTGETDRPAQLQPAFAISTHDYIVDVPANCDTVTVAGIKLPGCAELTVGGQPDALKTAVNPGQKLDVTVLASAGADPRQQSKYTVTVRKPLLSGIGCPGGTVKKAFDIFPAGASATAMEISMPYTADVVTLFPIGNDNGAGAVTFAYYEGATKLSGPVIAVAQGATRRITVRASCGSAFMDYLVAVTRGKSDNANLAALGASAGWLSPAFSAARTTYTLLLPETISSVTLKPVVADLSTKYKIDSLATNTARTVSLALKGSATVKIAVTALSGNTKTYTVTVRRLNMISAFSASPVYSRYPSLSPGGTDRMKFAYTLALPATAKVEVKKNGKWYAVLTKAETATGAKTFVWDGKVSGKYLPSGSYSVRVTPYWAGKAGTAKTLTVKILPKPTVSVPKLTPKTFTARGSARLTLSIKWSRLCDVKVEIVNSAGAVVKSLYSATNAAPATRTLYWDGRSNAKVLVPAGIYRVKVACGGAAVVYKPFTLKR